MEGKFSRPVWVDAPAIVNSSLNIRGVYVPLPSGRVQEAGPYLRRVDSCTTQLNAQGPSRTYNECTEKEKEESNISADYSHCQLQPQHPLPVFSPPESSATPPHGPAEFFLHHQFLFSRCGPGLEAQGLGSGVRGSQPRVQGSGFRV